jgi:ribosomal protein L17
MRQHLKNMAIKDKTILHFLHLLTKNNSQTRELLKTSSPHQRSVLRKICNLIRLKKIVTTKSEVKKLMKGKTFIRKLLTSNEPAFKYARNSATISLVARIFLGKNENYAKIGLSPPRRMAENETRSAKDNQRRGQKDHKRRSNGKKSKKGRKMATPDDSGPSTSFTIPTSSSSSSDNSSNESDSCCEDEERKETRGQDQNEDNEEN